jgi:hypothetical protein
MPRGASGLWASLVRRRAVVAFAGAAVFAAAVYFAGPMSARGVPIGSIAPGDAFVLDRPAGRDVPLCRTPEHLSQALDAIGTGKAAALRAMALGGQVVVVERGASVLTVEVRLECVRVRVTTGANTGTEGYVSPRWIER